MKFLVLVAVQIFIIHFFILPTYFRFTIPPAVFERSHVGKGVTGGR